MVIIEVDGETHLGKEEYDMTRDEYLESMGFCVIHVSAFDVRYNMDYLLDMLRKHPKLGMQV